MKISSELPQFEDQKSLLIVASRQDARFFIAHDGEIVKKGEIHIRTPRFSDESGKYAKRGGRGRFSGITQARASLKKNAEEELLNELVEKAGIIFDDDIEKIYLFASPYVVNDIPKKMNKDMKNAIVKSIKGNYTKEHPFELLRMILDKS